MKNILQDIQSGNFNKEWSQESKMGYRELMKMRKKERNSLIEKTTQIIQLQILSLNSEVLGSGNSQTTKKTYNLF